MAHTPATNHIGIDVTTRTKRRLIRRLAALKTTVDVQDGGVYGMCPEYSTVFLITTMTEAEVDEWYCRIKDDIDIAGTFEMQPAPAAVSSTVECPVCGRDGATVDPTGAATNTPLYHCHGCGLKWYFGG